MDDRNHDRFVDELLDAAVTRYSSAEPRTELEERVLAALRTSPHPVPWLRWRWVPVAVAAVIVAAAGMLLYTLLRPAPPTPPAVARSAEPRLPAAPMPAPRGSAPVAKPRRALPQSASPALAAASPRHNQFPVPAPLSEQELLLLRYAQEAPPEEWVAARLGQGPLERLRIEPLSIPPLGLGPSEARQHPN